MAKKTRKNEKTASVPVKRTEKDEPRKAEVVTASSPWKFLDDLRDEMEEMWRWPERLLTLPTLRALPRFPKLALPTDAGFMPSTDVYREKGSLVVKADLPGLTKEDVEVSVEDGYLVVEGERKEEKEKKEKKYYRSECSYGSFYRRVPVPADTDPEKISAKVTDGVLEVRVPLPEGETEHARRIEVK